MIFSLQSLSRQVRSRPPTTVVMIIDYNELQLLDVHDLVFVTRIGNHARPPSGTHRGTETILKVYKQIFFTGKHLKSFLIQILVLKENLTIYQI